MPVAQPSFRRNQEQMLGASGKNLRTGPSADNGDRSVSMQMHNFMALRTFTSGKEIADEIHN